MRFWDTSALVPLLVAEATTVQLLRELESDIEITVWWGTPAECISALARLERSDLLDAQGVTDAQRELTTLATAWDEVQPSERVRQLAGRMLRVHDLRALDAFQLAAALVAADDEPATLPFVVLDQRLARAADREGFPVVTPSRETGS